MNYAGAKAWILSYMDTRLSDKLTYHGMRHTLDVLHITEELCQSENIDSYHSILLKTAALLHDIGFTKSNKDHEIIGCEMTRAQLPQFGYTRGEIEVICEMIMATKIPQSPQNKFEKIICDADLDYLGRTDFPEISDDLYQELYTFKVIDNIKSWNKIQVSFIEKHRYFTQSNQERREPLKQSYLMALRKTVASYEDE